MKLNLVYISSKNKENDNEFATNFHEYKVGDYMLSNWSEKESCKF